ncbi:phenylalanine--tRNA ligase subunit beta [Boudabousia marimammalium]|uniref:Phenylalanine--tRNA ligase beta subunit n=1 Tax=Boudabousia marimammalium TaxID=156892 RepID=A0A1Q5PP34_9ACTO|nr:phenylalanine--tRNA ligase subunit beta [Boudabousia marimammalium]OKL49200.1 phenylalanine--tRNA ligase subunit beta [Boudabousia marimammalium]
MPYVSLEWLGAHVDVPADATVAELAADLVKVGLEEERIVPPAVQGPLVVGKVLTLDPKAQSNGKVINYCRVDVGEQFNDAPGTGAEPSELPSRGIICGAHNFKVGDHVVVSLPGAVLPGDFAIAARKTYGHVSDGMICSEAELGLADSAEGIIVLEEFLPGEVPAPGTDAIKLLGLGEETLEINITPDRGYCFSMRGVAREYSHSTGVQFHDPALVGNLVKEVPAANAEGFPVLIKDDAPIRGHIGCDRFVTRIVRSVNPAAPTPDWMVRRIVAAGMRPISLTVDITNYVMLDLGQPLHAYDLAQVSAPIVVRRAKAGESLVTLDEAKRELHVEDLLITDSPDGEGSRALGLAGVMGGASSEVTDKTTDVLIEAAHFDPITIARAARRHHLPSEASKRFERGVDPQLPAVAAQRVVDLLVEYGGGIAGPEVFDEDNTVAMPSLEFQVDAATKLIGVEYSRDDVVSALTKIGCEVSGEGDVLTVVPPTWRPDLVGSAHLVEEIARLGGYDELPSVVPQARISEAGLSDSVALRRQVAQALAASGHTQVISYPFIGQSHDLQGFAEDDPRRQALALANPIANDAPRLRTSILDTLLTVAQRNIARGNSSLSLYELGMVTRPAGTPAAVMPEVQTPSVEQVAAIRSQVPAQPWHVGGVLAGSTAPEGVLVDRRSYDWADAIESAQLVASTIGVELLVAQPILEGEVPAHINPRALQGQGIEVVTRDSLAPFHPGRVAQLRIKVGKKQQTVGYAGELHPRVVDAFNLPRRACAFELDLQALGQVTGLSPLQVSPISTYPMGKEDIAVIVDEQITAGELLADIMRTGGELLEDAYLFDVYRSDQLPEGKKSLAFSLQTRGSDHTLTAEEQATVRERVLASLAKRFGAEHRSA